MSVGLPLGKTLSRLLKIKYNDKTKRHRFRMTKEYKKDRKEVWTNNYKLLREKQMSNNKNRLDYEAGLIMTLARSILKLNKVKQNPKGTADVMLRCPYHQRNWCNALEHTSM